MLPEVVAYYAGLFDGEGCVYLNKNTKRWGCYVLSASVVMTDPIVLKALLRDFGGSFSTCGRQLPHHRQPYKWMAKAQKAAAFLRTIRPYTLVKSEQIDVALEFQARLSSFEFKRGTGRRLPVEEKLLREDYWQRLKDLKRLVIQGDFNGIGANSGNGATPNPELTRRQSLKCVETLYPGQSSTDERQERVQSNGK